MSSGNDILNSHNCNCGNNLNRKIQLKTNQELIYRCPLAIGGPNKEF